MWKEKETGGGKICCLEFIGDVNRIILSQYDIKNMSVSAKEREISFF